MKKVTGLLVVFLLASAMGANAGIISINLTNGDAPRQIAPTDATGVTNAIGWVNLTNSTTAVDGTVVDVTMSKTAGTSNTARDGSSAFLALYEAGLRDGTSSTPDDTFVTVSNLTAYMAAEGETSYEIIAYYKSAVTASPDGVAIGLTTGSLTNVNPDGAGISINDSFVESANPESNYIIFSGLTSDSASVYLNKVDRDGLLTGIQVICGDVPVVEGPPEDVIGALVWTGAATSNSTGNVTNWLNTATGTYPEDTPNPGLDRLYTEGVFVTNGGTTAGTFVLGTNELLVAGGSTISDGGVIGGLTGGPSFPSVTISNATFSMWWCAQASIILSDNALMNLDGGGGPLGGGAIHSTVDIVSGTAQLQFNNEDLDAFIAEHEAFITVNGAPAVFGADYYVEESGDNAIALAHNGILGIEIQGLGFIQREPIGTIVIAGPIAGNMMTITWDSTLDQVYNVETNSNLIVANWGVADSTVGTGGSITVTTAVDQAETFYKVTTP